MELFYSERIEGNNIYLKGDQANHCFKVLRHRVGDEIFVIDGVGGLYRCVIHQISKISVELTVKERLHGIGETQYQLTMAVCPTKNIDRYEWFIEKATEIGIERIVPLLSDHSIRNTVKLERLRSIALSATKQSLKAYLPKIEEITTVKDFISNFASEFDIALIAHCEEDNKVTIRNYLDSWFDANKSALSESGDNDEKPKIAILIGPEGDFTANEIAMAKGAGFRPITLGESRLRVETAALVSVSEIYFYFTNFVVNLKD